ncbi:hypothetical protein [uncultured Polaribacter sp.]|uniref:hypothetical protein n=1 Tax=uncultured Polaribacter sp. TaxID=174711 RepID=UPI00261D485F|nr:hypothetical protein [uncultured Polaribacter sp.]
MKAIKRKVLVVVFMLGTLINYANNETEFTNVNAKKVRVVFNNVNKGHFLSVKDKNGYILHKEEVTKTGKLTKIFDLSSLIDGSYEIELNKDFEIVIKPFQVTKNKVIFNKELENVIFKPVIRNKENVLMISKITFDNEPIKVELFYNDNSIYTETIHSNKIANRTYKLDKKLKGDYKVVITNNGRSYFNNFKI